MIEVPRFVPARQDFTIPTLRPPAKHDSEHPPHPGRKDFIVRLTPTPDYYPALPYYLRKYVLKKIMFEEGTVPDLLWTLRGEYIERRVEGLLTGQEGVRKVTRHGHNGRNDALGRDLTLRGLGVYVQVKSTSFGIHEFKRAIKDKYFPGTTNTGQVDRWMTKHGIILINGSETRSDAEIINYSYLPQLRRIQDARRALAGKPGVNIGLMAFSGTAKPDDAPKWIKQNPKQA